MDSSLYQYKGKLKEALDLVPVMNSNEKLQAVSYWNNFAEQLQNTVHDNILVSGQDNQNRQVTDSSSFYNEQTDYYDSDHQTTDFLINNGTNLAPLITLIEQQSPPSTSAPLPETNSGPYSQTTSNSDVLYGDSSLVTQNQNFKINSLQLDTVGDEIKTSPLLPIQNYDSTQVNVDLSVNSTSHSIQSVFGNQYTAQSSLIPQSYPVQDCMELSNNSKLHYQPHSPMVYGNQSHLEPDPTSNCALVPVPIASVDVEKICYDSIQKQQFQNSGYIHYSADYQITQANTHNDSPCITLDRSQTYTGGEKPLRQIQCSNPSMGETTQSLDPLALFKPRADLDSTFVIDDRKSTNYNNSSYSFQPVPERDLESTFGLNEINHKSACHVCEVCGKSGFSTKGNLKRHLRAHSGEKPFKCDYCDSCFTEKKSLKIHLRRHTGEKPYKCDICDKLFSQTGVLQSHKALHYNQREFKCHLCDKAFRQRSQLKVHLMRHEGVKRLQCSSCDAKFLTKGDLERHRRTHTGERPYACELCSKTFTRQQSLREHVNRHTGKKSDVVQFP